MMRHRARKASLINQIFTDQQYEVLQSVDAHLGAARMGLKDVANVLAKDLEVMRLYLKKAESFYYPVALRVYAKTLVGVHQMGNNFSEISFRGVLPPRKTCKRRKSSSPRDSGWVLVPGQRIDIIPLFCCICLKTQSPVAPEP